MQIDYTQLQTFITCPMKYNLKFIEGLKKRDMDERHVDIEFGQRVHKGLELLYMKEPMKKVLSVFDTFVDLPPEVEKNKTKENGVKLLEGYIEHYKTIDKEIEIIDVEVSDTIEIAPNLLWQVKLDTVVKMRDNIYVLEHKTTKRLDYRYFLRYSPNMQVSGYTYYALKKYKQCSGCMLNVLQSGYRSRAYKGEPAGFNSKYQREIINRTVEQLEDFRLNAVLWSDRLNKELVHGWSVGKNEDACHQFRGCSFKEICMTSRGDVLDNEIVETLYERINPLEYLQSGN